MGNRVLLIPGHGAGDPGAVGNGFTEAECVRLLAARMRNMGTNVSIWLEGGKNCYSETKYGRGLYGIGASDYDVVYELHLDSASSSARGGHVIIESSLSADSVDKAIRDVVVEYFPGRSNSLVKRGDLLNVNVAQRRGINYRLVEHCFISNAEDIKKFISEIDSFAFSLVKACGTEVKGGTNTGAGTTGWVKPPTKAEKLDVDGWLGPKTTVAWQKRMGTTQDGVISNQHPSDSMHVNADGRLVTLEVLPVKGYRSQLITNVQQYLNTKGYSLNVDGFLGKNTAMALQRYLNTLKGFNLRIDGYLGEKSIKALQTVLNEGLF